MSFLLTEEEKARVRTHLGFPGTSNPSVYMFGQVINVQGSFLVESAMDHLMEHSASRVRQLLGVCDGLEQKMIKAACYLTVESVGDIKMRPNKGGESATDALRREYVYWAERLADELGVPYYPYASHFKGGSMNVRVSR